MSDELSSKLKERHEAKGEVSLILRDEKGKVIDKRETSNMIVTTGRTLVADLFRGGGEKPVSYIAVGEGATGPTPDDTKLEKEVGRKTIESAVEKTTTVLKVNFDYKEANGNLNEAGLFNSETEGVMYSRVVFGPPSIAKTEKFTFTLVWRVTF